VVFCCLKYNKSADVRNRGRPTYRSHSRSWRQCNGLRHIGGGSYVWWRSSTIDRPSFFAESFRKRVGWLRSRDAGVAAATVDLCEARSIVPPLCVWQSPWLWRMGGQAFLFAQFIIRSRANAPLCELYSKQVMTAGTSADVQLTASAPGLADLTDHVLQWKQTSLGTGFVCSCDCKSCYFTEEFSKTKG